MPSHDDQLTKLNSMYAAARRAKDLIEKDWTDVQDMLRGKQLPPELPKYKPRAVMNMIRPLVERKISMLTDTKPRFNVNPTRAGEGHAKAAKLLDEAANAWWDDQCVDMRYLRAVFYAAVYGASIVQTRWSVTDQEIILDPIDPHMFYVDPYIASAEQLADAEYVIYEEYPSLDWVRMKWGTGADDVKPWSPPPADGEQVSKKLMKRLSNMFGRSKTDDTAVQRTLLRHFWIKDYSTRDLEVTQQGETTPMRERRFPGGRYLVWAYPGVILHDEPNPYYDGIHPFDMLDWYMDTDSPWGDGEVAAHRYPQQLLNKLAEVLVENGMLMNNAIWICDQNAFPADDGPLGWGQLRNAPGNIIKKRPGTSIERSYPQGIPSSLLQLLQHIENFIESRAGGMPEILSKGKSGQMQSGIGIDQLQQTASAMIRLRARAAENFLQRVGQKVISRIIQFYTNDRMFHVLGPGEEYTQHTFIRKHFTDAVSGVALRDAHKDFRFRVVPGSSLSMTKIQKALMAVQLKTMGLLSGEAVLHAIEWPDAKAEFQKAIDEMKWLAAQGVGPPPQKKGGSKKGYGAQERQMKVAGRT